MSNLLWAGRILCDGKTNGSETPQSISYLARCMIDFCLLAVTQIGLRKTLTTGDAYVCVYAASSCVCVCLWLGEGWWNEVMNSWNFYHPQRVHGSVCCMINTVSPTTDRQLSGSCPMQSGSLSVKLGLGWAFRGVTWQVGLCHIGCSLGHIITSPLHTKLSLFPKLHNVNTLTEDTPCTRWHIAAHYRAESTKVVFKEKSQSQILTFC